MPPTNLQRILENTGLNTATKRQRIQAFLASGGDINALEENGNPPLLNEIQYGTEETVNLLIDLGADVNVRGKKQANALLHSLHLFSPENGYTGKIPLATYKTLIDKTTNINAIDDEGFTALMRIAHATKWATQQEEKENSIKIIEYLLEKEADINKMNLYGNTAYELANKNVVGEELYSRLRPTNERWIREQRQRYNSYNNSEYHSNNNNRNNNNRNNNNAWEQQNSNDRIHPVGPLYKQVTNAILAIPPSPKTTRVEVPIGATTSITVFDPIEAGDISLTRDEIAADRDNIYFKVGTTYARLPTESILAYLNDFSAIQFACKREMVFDRDGAPTLSDVSIDQPYYLISTVGKYLVPLGDILWVLTGADIGTNVYALVPQGTTLPNVASFSAIQKPYQRGNRDIMNYSGRVYSILGKDHCTSGTERQVYSLEPVVFVTAAAANGGKRRRRSKRKTLKKRHRVLPTRRRPRRATM